MESYKLNEADFTASVPLVDIYTELFMRTVDRGTVDGIIAGRDFYGLVYGYQEFTVLTGVGTGAIVHTLGDTAGVADNPHMGTATKSTNEIFVYEATVSGTLGAVQTQINDAAVPATTEFSLSANRKTVNVHHTTGTTHYYQVFYLLSTGTLRLDVKNGDKSIRRQLMRWKLKQLNEHDYADVNQKIVMPNGWLVEERYLYGFSVKAPVEVKTSANTTAFNPTRLSLWIARGDWHTLSKADKEKVKSYTKQMY